MYFLGPNRYSHGIKGWAADQWSNTEEGIDIFIAVGVLFPQSRILN